MGQRLGSAPLPHGRKPLPNQALQLTAGVRGVRARLPAAAGSGAGRAVGGRMYPGCHTAGGS
jgi:hypothetical protein